MSPRQSRSASPLPLVRGFPALRVPYGRVRLPPPRPLPYGWSVRSAYSTELAFRQDNGGSLRSLDASVSERAVLSDPAAVSSPIAFAGAYCCLPGFSTLSACGLSCNEAQSLHLRYGPLIALPTLNSSRYLHEPKARFSVGWLLPLAETGIAPAGSIRLLLTHRKSTRKSFDCGDASTNDFLQRYARQSHEAVPRKPFLQLTTQTTSPSSVSTAWLRALGLTLTRWRWFAAASPGTMCLVPARAHRNRRSLAGEGLGGQLLAAAARRCLRAAAEVGGVVLIIDAKDDRAARWYANYGAVPLSNKPLTLVMSLATFAADLKAAGQL